MPENCTCIIISTILIWTSWNWIWWVSQCIVSYMVNSFPDHKIAIIMFPHKGTSTQSILCYFQWYDLMYWEADKLNKQFLYKFQIFINVTTVNHHTVERESDFISMETQLVSICSFKLTNNMEGTHKMVSIREYIDSNIPMPSEWRFFKAFIAVVCSLA